MPAPLSWPWHSLWSPSSVSCPHATTGCFLLGLTWGIWSPLATYHWVFHIGNSVQSLSPGSILSSHSGPVTAFWLHDWLCDMFRTSRMKELISTPKWLFLCLLSRRVLENSPVALCSWQSPSGTLSFHMVEEPLLRETSFPQTSVKQVSTQWDS
jgi:hypothetical protein